MALRAAELEILYSANTAGIDQAEKKTKESAQRVESRPVVQKIDGDSRAALQDISRVEAEARALVAAHRVVSVDSDPSEALAGMDRVEAQAKQLVSERAVLSLDAKIDNAEKALDRAKAKVEDLSILANSGFDVTADTKRAEAALSRAEQQLDRLRTARANVEVDADTAKAVANLGKLEDAAKQAGERAGSSGGSSLVSSLDGATRGAGEKVGAVVGGDVEESLISALTAIPIAGGIVLAGVAIGKAITGAVRDGLQQEVGFDRLEALTGISPSSALRIGRAAGEAYANVFGDSVEANLNTARLALQFDIIDGDASATESRKVVEGLAGISDVMQEDVQPVARATAQLLRTGLAKNAQEAFDIIVAGEREGVNLSDDLLDTLSEYASTFKALGLTGGETLGLLNQGLKAGAPNTDFFATAIQELGIRIREGDEATAGFAQRLNLVPGELQRAFIEGGPAARDALDLIFDRLRDTDPIDRNAIAVGLLGTQFEDLQLDLSQLDLSNAESSLNGVQGAAQRMFETLADNDASKIEQAGRNIEVATDAIKGALASVASDPIGEIADFVSENRGPVLRFLSDLVKGSFDFGIALAEGTAAGAEGLGRLVSGPLASAVSGLAQVSGFFGRTEDAQTLKDLATEMRGFSDQTDAAAGFIRDKLVPSLEEGKKSVGGYLEGAVNLGYLNDASLRLADALDVVGDNGEGAKLSLEGVDLANLSASKSGETLERQLVNAAAALEEQLAAAEATGEGQDDLTAKYNTTRDALISQIEQMGIGRDAAAALVDEVLRTPESASTAFSSNAPEQQGLVQNLASRIETLPDGSVVIRADTRPANDAVEAMIEGLSNRRVTIAVGLGGAGGITRAYGGPIVGPGGPRDDVVPVMASNGEHMLPADEVQAAGGHDGVYRLRRMLKSGALRLADGGPVRAPADSTWRTVGPRADIVERVSSPSTEVVSAVAAAMRQIDRGAGGRGDINVPVYATFEQRDETLQARALGREIRNILASS